MTNSIEEQESMLESLRNEISNMNMRTLEANEEDYGLRFTRGGGSRVNPDPIPN